MFILRFVVLRVCMGVMAVGAGNALAQDYPNKVVRIITGGAGGGSDVDARLIAPRISGPLGQPVVVENRPTNLTGEVVAKASPDGYTLLVTGSAFFLLPLLQSMPYDPIRDFAPITSIESAPNILVVHPSLPVKSVKELIALAKARPGELNYASAVTASASHLAGELFNSMAQVNIVRVPYKGTEPAVTGLVGGHVQLMFASTGAVEPHVKSGRLRALAITSEKPSPLAPGLSTVADAGLPGYEASFIASVLAPAKTPAAIITRLNQEIVRVLNQPDIKEKLQGVGAEVVPSSPEQLSARMKSDIAKWGKVIKDANIKPD